MLCVSYLSSEDVSQFVPNAIINALEDDTVMTKPVWIPAQRFARWAQPPLNTATNQTNNLIWRRCEASIIDKPSFSQKYEQHRPCSPTLRSETRWRSTTLGVVHRCSTTGPRRRTPGWENSDRTELRKLVTNYGCKPVKVNLGRIKVRVGERVTVNSEGPPIEFASTEFNPHAMSEEDSPTSTDLNVVKLQNRLLKADEELGREDWIMSEYKRMSNKLMVEDFDLKERNKKLAERKLEQGTSVGTMTDEVFILSEQRQRGGYWQRIQRERRQILG